MSPYEIVPPGSLNIEDITLHVGGVEMSSPEQLLQLDGDEDNRGNKCVIAEMFVDKEGNPVDAEQYNFRTTAYGIFVAPISEKGRHKNVIPYLHQHGVLKAQIGKITGGGLISVPDPDQLKVSDYSGDYKAEPNSVRVQLAKLLLQEVSAKFGCNEMQLSKDTKSYSDWVNPYWLRFAQVLEAAEGDFEKQQFDDLLQRYLRQEKGRVSFGVWT